MCTRSGHAVSHQSEVRGFVPVGLRVVVVGNRLEYGSLGVLSCEDGVRHAQMEDESCPAHPRELVYPNVSAASRRPRILFENAPRISGR